MKEIRVNNLKKEEKIIYIIKDRFPNLSSSTLYKALRNKDIKVNEKRINNPEYLVKSNDLIQIYINDSLLFGLPKEVNIQYEDDNILVAYKPQGILSNNEDNEQTEPTFEDFVKSVKEICHRLDRNTSGLIIFSKNNTSYSNLLEAFKEGYITKEYIAYVSGTSFDNTTYHYENYILKDNKLGISRIYNKNLPNSQKIVTDIFVEKVYKQKDYSILRVIIHTGKTHQIRALLSSISHPIIGDPKYGKNEINKKFKKYKQLLYAVKYSFKFPKNSKLYYLNNISINLDTNIYTHKL